MPIWGLRVISYHGLLPIGITLTLAFSHRGRGDWTPPCSFRWGLCESLLAGKDLADALGDELFFAGLEGDDGD